MENYFTGFLIGITLMTVLVFVKICTTIIVETVIFNRELKIIQKRHIMEQKNIIATLIIFGEIEKQA